jgi:hypothetical protein
MGASSSSDKKPPPKREAAQLFTLAHFMEGARDGATLTTHKDAAWSCDDTYHAKLNPLGKRTRAARLSPHALCAGFEALARKHLEEGPPIRTCFCDTVLCASARNRASLTVFNEAFPGPWLTDDTVGLMALEPLQALASRAKRIYTERELSAGVMLTPLSKGKRATDVLLDQQVNDVFKNQSGGTAARRELFRQFKKHDDGQAPRLEFADFTFHVVKSGIGEVVVTLSDGSEYDFHQSDHLLDKKPEEIALVYIEDGGASNKGIIRVLACVKDPENPEERGPASCLRYYFRTLSLAS